MPGLNAAGCSNGSAAAIVDLPSTPVASAYRPFLAGECGRCCEQLRDICGHPFGFSGRCRGVETDEPWPVGVDDHVISIEISVDNAGTLQRSDVLPDLHEQIVTRFVRTELRKQRAARRPLNEQRGMRTCAPGNDDRWNARARLTRHEHDVRLVLDLLDASQRKRRS